MTSQTDQTTLVVPSSIIPSGTNTLEIGDLTPENGQPMMWMPRHLAENSRHHLQIIPVATVHDANGRYHVFRRTPSQHDYLSGKLALTVGGHIEPQDQGSNLTETMMNALRRELLEEIGITEKPSKPEFAVFDPKSPHLAVVHRVMVTTPVVPTADEFREEPARLMEEPALAQMAKQLDPWSAIIISRVVQVGENGTRF